MRRNHHRSPLQSFRFWFVLLSLFALAAAWKLDLFGNRRPGAKADLVDELPEPDPKVEPVAMLSDVTKPGSAAPEPLESDADKPAPLPPRQIAQSRPMQPAPTTRSRSQAATAEPRNPFGPANPEFVAMPENGPTLFDSRQTAVLPAEAAPQQPAEPGAAVSMEDVRPFQRRPRMAEQEEPMPPDLTRPRPLSSELAGGRKPANPFTMDDRIQRASNLQETGITSAVENAAASEVSKPAFQLPAGSKVNLATIAELIEAGNDIEAHRMMSEWYWKEPRSRPAFQKQLESLARKIYLQSKPHYMDPHVVQDGEMLAKIAKEYNVPWQYLAKLNRTDARRIKPGQKLKVIKGPFSAVVDLSDYELTIHAHGYFVKRYDVCIGRDNSSPTGSFKIQDKQADPTYYGPNGVIEHDDPENPLGEHWLSIGDSFGIHGTIHPESIGKAESDGCIRLRNEEVAEVFDFLSIGSDVVIRP